MEVHHHAHTSRKKWTHYFWEFLMLFLAVTAGFFVENIREHHIEHKREKQFIRSYIEDLRLDTFNISGNIILRTNKIKTLDSLIRYLNEDDVSQYSGNIYYWARQLTRTNRLISTDRTIKQLKNAGGLRLVRHRGASDSIMAYDELIDRFYYSQDRQTNEILSVSPLMGKLLNANVLETMIQGQTIVRPTGNPPLRSQNKELVLDFIYYVHQLKTSDVYLISSLITMKIRAVGIIQFLQEQYHL